MPTPYNKKRRSKAGFKGWDTRRKNATQFKQQDYGIDQGVGTAAEEETEELGGPLPVERLALFGNIAGWQDDVHEIDANGYRIIHNCFPVIESVNKLGIRTSKLDWTVVGEGERADAIRDIVQQAKNWADMIKWITWAEVDGVRFIQIKSAEARAGGEPWIVPDFFMGGRRKAKANGSIQWDGGDRLVLENVTTGVADQETQVLPIDQFIIHRPGAGSNPEGDLNRAVAVFRIARSWNEALKNTDAHMELFGIPIRVFKTKMDDVPAANVSAVMAAKAAKIRQLRQNKEVALADKDMLELIEPKGRGFEDMMKHSQYLEGLIDQMFLGNTLTSKTNEGGRTGNTETHKSEEDEVAFCNGLSIAASLNRHLMPWITRKNPDLPELKEGEFEAYLWPQNPEEDDEQDIEIEDPGMTDVPPGEIEPVDPDAVIEDPVPPEGEVVADGNPWRVEKRGEVWVVVQIDTGEVVGTHDNEEDAIAQQRALEAAEPEPVEDSEHDEPEQNQSNAVLVAGDTDHAHTVELDEAGNGTSSMDESEEAGPHSHEVIANEVQPAGANDHTHAIEEPEEPEDPEAPEDPEQTPPDTTDTE